jgi:mannonate dehydratase
MDGWLKAPLDRKAHRRRAARSIEFLASDVDLQTPIPNGMVWNMTYNLDAPEGNVDPVSREEIWQRFEYFLTYMLPVAEENKVKLVAHPDDPPLAELRRTARLFYTGEEYEKLLEISSSPASGFEFCMGTIQAYALGFMKGALNTLYHHG